MRRSVELDCHFVIYHLTCTRWNSHAVMISFHERAMIRHMIINDSAFASHSRGIIGHMNILSIIAHNVLFLKFYTRVHPDLASINSH